MTKTRAFESKIWLTYSGNLNPDESKRTHCIVYHASSKREYCARDSLRACVYILCLHSVVSDEYNFITKVLHKTPKDFERYNPFLRLKKETVFSIRI